MVTHPPTMSVVIQPFLIGFALAAALVPACRALARRTGVVAHPRDDRWHRETVPLLGGVAIAVSMLVAAAVTGVGREIVVPLSAAVVMCVVGLVDDVLSLKPSTKLIAQIVLAAGLVSFGYRLNWFESRLLDSLLTTVWVVGLTNAFNLLDNMDGLCAGTALIVAAMLIAGLLTGATRAEAGPEIALLAVLAGSVAGFLIYNFPPASIFMGDSGSLLLGFSLASLTLSPEGVRGSRADVLSVIAGPVFVLLIPIFDTTLVTASRLLSGRSPATGGRDHSSHRLVAIGLSERTAVFVLWFLAAVGGVIGITLRHASEGWSMLAGAVFLLALCLLAAFLARVRVYDAAEAATDPSSVTLLTADFMYKRRVAEVVLDFCLIGIAYYGAYHLRFEGPEEFLAHSGSFYESLPLVLATQLVAFFVIGVYRGTWHSFGLMDGVVIAQGVVLGTVAVQLPLFWFYRYGNYSTTVFSIYALLVGVLVMTSRASFRLMGEFVQRLGRSSRRAVIYGAGETAGMALRELQQYQGTPLRIVGFVDDHPRMARTRILGYPVIGAFAALERLIHAGAVDLVVLNRAHLSGERLATLESICRARDVALLRLTISIDAVVAADTPAPQAEPLRNASR